MKIHELLIIRNFLLELKNQHQNELFLPVTDVFQNLLSHKELRLIIEQMTGGRNYSDDPNFSHLSKKELLQCIGDQYYILEYCIARIEREVGI